MSQPHLVHKTSGYYTAIDKTPIYYETFGEGEPLVLIYGIACLINHWHYQIDYFSKFYKVIVFDIRGHHKSTPVSSTDNLTLDHLAFDIKGLLNHLGHKNAYFAGHSYGVPYLIYSAFQFPEIFRGLVLVNGFAKNPLKRGGFDFVEPLYYFLKDQHERHPRIVEALWKNIIDNPLSLYVIAMSGGFNIRYSQFKDIEVYAKGVAHLDLPVFFELFKYILYFDGTPLLKLIHTPTLVIAGDHDMITPIEYQKELSEKLPHAEFVLVAEGSHCTQLDFPERVNAEMEEFFDNLKTTAKT